MNTLTAVILKNSKRQEKKNTFRERMLSFMAFAIVFLSLSISMAVMSIYLINRLKVINQEFTYINILLLMDFLILFAKSIFESINSLLQFSQNQTLIGVDNQMPLLNYIFIKAKPKGMFTNYEFMELYIGEKIKKNEGNYLAQLKSIIDFTFSLTPQNLFNITDDTIFQHYKTYYNYLVKFFHIMFDYIQLNLYFCTRIYMENYSNIHHIICYNYLFVSYSLWYY